MINSLISRLFVVGIWLAVIAGCSNAGDVRGSSTGGSGGGVDGGNGNDSAAVNEFPCTDPQPLIAGAETGYQKCASGAIHRTAKTSCPPRTTFSCGATNPDPAVTPGCSSDFDCTEHPDGQCRYNPPIPPSPGFPGSPYDSCGCSYGHCLTDADCGSAQICLCDGPQAGTCVSATCTSDADCGSGFLCRTLPATPCHGGSVFSCQAPADICNGGSDCGAANYCSAANGPAVCLPIDCES